MLTNKYLLNRSPEHNCLPFLCNTQGSQVLKAATRWEGGDGDDWRTTALFACVCERVYVIAKPESLVFFSVRNPMCCGSAA